MIGVLRQVLGDQGVELADNELRALSGAIEAALIHARTSRRRGERQTSDRGDILHWIAIARESGERDEALWRAFLAAHFGRDSARYDDRQRVTSAARLLCAFAETPVWTYSEVQDAVRFRSWLDAHVSTLQSLKFGNHRKYESHSPLRLSGVVASFIAIVSDFGGSPTALFETPDELSREDRFERLYCRLGGLDRFARTGRFDFLTLLSDMRLIQAEPGSCYLRGATGPLRGARQLWGAGSSTRRLDGLAANLATALDLSPRVLEDALCNWQKSG